MNVYTYNDPIPHLHDPGLIELWAESWRKHGWTPVVLSKVDAQKHPEFPAFMRAIQKLPTVNDKTYEYACYFRWLAMTTTVGGVMSDFDVINYGLRPRDVEFLDTCTLLETRMPSAVSGTPSAFAKACEMFCEFKPNADCCDSGRPHCSDMIIVQANVCNLLEDVQCVEYTDPGWEASKLVHFATSKLRRPKTQRIMELRKP